MKKNMNMGRNAISFKSNLGILIYRFSTCHWLHFTYDSSCLYPDLIIVILVICVSQSFLILTLLAIMYVSMFPLHDVAHWNGWINNMFCQDQLLYNYNYNKYIKLNQRFFLSICYQEKIYSVCRECCLLCVGRWVIIFLTSISLFFTEGVSVVYLGFLKIHMMFAVETSYLCWGALICMSVSV